MARPAATSKATMLLLARDRLGLSPVDRFADHLDLLRLKLQDDTAVPAAEPFYARASSVIVRW
jgi:hypothetical protein